ncbi:HK97 gp10 family phage protein [Sphingomonadaceae bacterium OTU29LAMAA1]|nr:HK97 gp10 family phage protein [Sphingomonadaceae bacterium OTU29LAMAA1]
MAKRRGGAGWRRRMEQLPQQLVKRVLPGAARTGAKVIAGEAKVLLGGRLAEVGGGAKVLIADAVKVRSKKREGLVVARVLLDGPGSYVGRWLEYGTDPHFITVDDGKRQGLTTRRVNSRIKDGDSALHATLVINGKAVGPSVYHPGATAHPFMRPALDVKRTEAVAAAQSYINSRVRRAGIIGNDEGDET